MPSMMTKTMLCLGISVAFGCAHLAPEEKPALAAAPAAEKIARAAIASPVKPKVTS